MKSKKIKWTMLGLVIFLLILSGTYLILDNSSKKEKNIDEEKIYRNYKISTEFKLTDSSNVTKKAKVTVPISIKDEIVINNNDFERSTILAHYLEGKDEIIYKEYKVSEDHIIYDNYVWISSNNENSINDLYPVMLMNYVNNNVKKGDTKIILNSDILNKLFDFNSYHIFTNSDIKNEIVADITFNEKGDIESLTFKTDYILAGDNEVKNHKYENIEFKISFEYDNANKIILPDDGKEFLTSHKYNSEYAEVLKEYLKKFGDKANTWPTNITLEKIKKKGIKLNHLNNCDMYSSSKKTSDLTYETNIVCNDYENEIIINVTELEKKHNITILNVYVNDKESSFSEKEIEQSEIDLKFGLDKIKTFGNYYGVTINFNYNEDLRYIYNTDLKVPTKGRSGELEENSELTNLIFKYLEENSDYKNLENVYVIINTNKSGRSFAVKPSSYTYIYYDIDAQHVYAHELLHLFGSNDIYSLPDGIRDLYYYDIMNSEDIIRNEYGPYSAFYSNWLLYLDKDIYDMIY